MRDSYGIFTAVLKPVGNSQEYLRTPLRILKDKHGRRAHDAGALKWIYKREKKKDGKVKLKDVTGTKIFPPLPNMSRFDVQQSEAPTLEE